MVKTARLTGMLHQILFESACQNKFDALHSLVPYVQVAILVRVAILACYFTKSNTPPSVFFTFFKLCKS